MLAYMQTTTGSSSASTSSHSSPMRTTTPVPALASSSQHPHPLSQLSSAAAMNLSNPTSPFSTPRFNEPTHPATPPPFTLAAPGPSVLVKPRDELFSSQRHDGGDNDDGIMKVCDGVRDAIREFEDLLLGDVESSSSESDEPKKQTTTTLNQVQAQREKYRRNKDKFPKGIARDMGMLQLIVDIPVWTPDCFADLTTMQSLRDQTLQSLHNIIDTLRLRANIRTTYRLLSTANGGAWGCIRIAKFVRSPSTSPNVSSLSSVPKLTTRMSSIQIGASSSTTGAASSSMTPALMLGQRRQTVAAIGNVRRLSQLELEAEQDREREEVGEWIKKGLQVDCNGVVMEGRSYLMTIHNQPALIFT